MPKERDLMRKWIKGHLEKHPDDYWLRLFDGVYGNFRPADGILFCHNLSFMMEFKVERRKKFAYKLEQLPAHQKRELGIFDNGRCRVSIILIYHLHEKTWHILPFRKSGVKYVRKFLYASSRNREKDN